MANTRNPTAAWPTDSLIRSLAVNGWGNLAGRSYQGVRSTLRALVDELPYGSGEGVVSAWKIARTTGLSDRWTRRCLNVLEGMGVISWVRGGVVDGKPQGSFIRIVKKVLVALIADARKLQRVEIREHRRKVANRVAQLPDTCFSPRGKNSHRSNHAELSATNPALIGRGLRPSTLNNDEKEPLRGAHCHKRHRPKLRLDTSFHLAKGDDAEPTRFEIEAAYAYARQLKEQREADKRIAEIQNDGITDWWVIGREILKRKEKERWKNRYKDM